MVATVLERAALQYFSINLSGKVRRETLHGKEYAVCPLTLIVPGVLNGSRGPLLYPPKEINRTADAWNGVPLVVGHPSGLDGHVSGRDPKVLNEVGIGYVFHAKIKNDKLVAEGWFDVEKTRKIDNRIYDAVIHGRKMELSTGLYTDNEPAPHNATYNGKPYVFVARNYRPDHLAILPDQIGACSVNDGCGVNVNSCSDCTVDDPCDKCLQLNANPEGCNQYKACGTGDSKSQFKSGQSVKIKNPYGRDSGTVRGTIVGTGHETVSEDSGPTVMWKVKLEDGSTGEWKQHDITDNSGQADGQSSPAKKQDCANDEDDCEGAVDITQDGPVFRVNRLDFLDTLYDRELKVLNSMLEECHNAGCGCGHCQSIEEDEEVENDWSPQAIRAAVAARRARSQGAQHTKQSIQESRAKREVVKSGAKRSMQARIASIQQRRDIQRQKAKEQVQQRVDKVHAKRDEKRAAGKDAMAAYKAADEKYKSVSNWLSWLTTNFPLAEYLAAQYCRDEKGQFSSCGSGGGGADSVLDDVNKKIESGIQKVGDTLKSAGASVAKALGKFGRGKKKDKTTNDVRKYTTANCQELNREYGPHAAIVVTAVASDLFTDTMSASTHNAGAVGMGLARAVPKSVENLLVGNWNGEPVHESVLIAEIRHTLKTNAEKYNLGLQGFTDDEIRKRIRVYNAVNQPHSSATGQFKRLNAGTGKGAAHEAAQRGGIHLTSDDILRGSDAKSQSDAGHNPASWVTDEDKWQKAKVAADKGEYYDDTYWAVVTHIYRNMGGGFSGKAENLNPVWKLIGNLLGMVKNTATRNAFCPTGDGGGQDNSCSPGGGNGKSDVGAVSQKAIDLSKSAKSEKSHYAAATAHNKAWREIATRMKAEGKSNADVAKDKMVGFHQHMTAFHSEKAQVDPKYNMGKHPARTPDNYENLARKEFDERADNSYQRKNSSAKDRALNADYFAMGTYSGGNTMTMSAKDRTKIVNQLITANCSCFGEEDRDTLNSFDDEKLKKLRKQILTDNAEPEDGEMEDDDEEDEAVAPKKGKVPPQFLKNASDKELQAELKRRQTANQQDDDDIAAEILRNRRKPQTAEEFLAEAPPEIRSAVTNAMAIERREKAELIKQLTANVDDNSVARVMNMLKTKSIAELRDLVALMPPPQRPNVPNYLGAAAPYTSNERPIDHDDDDGLALPTINFAKEYQERLGGKAKALSN